MDQKYKQMAVACMMLAMLSACSSSNLDEGAPEEQASVSEEGAPAQTDSVAEVDPALDGEASSEVVPESLDPNLAVVQEPSALPEEAPIEAPLAEAPVEAPAEPSLPADQTVLADSQGVLSGETTQYQVKRGDTLMKIAFEQFGDLYRWREILESNRDRIKDPNFVPPGTLLQLSGAGLVQIERNGEQYLIKRGDTLGSISGEVYGTTQKWKKLWENNRQLIKDPNKIYAGFYLYYQLENRLGEGVPSTESEDRGPASSEEPAASN